MLPHIQVINQFSMLFILYDYTAVSRTVVGRKSQAYPTRPKSRLGIPWSFAYGVEEIYKFLFCTRSVVKLRLNL